MVCLPPHVSLRGALPCLRRQEALFMFRSVLGRVCVCVLAFASLGVVAASGAPAPADLYVAPSGSDANACTAAQPCLTMNRVYGAAHAGQVVELAGGTYPVQTIQHVAPLDSAAS